MASIFPEKRDVSHHLRLEMKVSSSVRGLSKVGKA